MIVCCFKQRSLKSVFLHHMVKHLKTILVLLLFGSSALHAQRQYATHTNGWLMYFGSHKFADKWGLHLEAQLRRHNLVTDDLQVLFRTGINYHPGPNAFVTAGYCFVQTAPYGGFPAKAAFPENRIWQQVQVKNQLSRFEIVSRFRSEQRYVNVPVLTDSVWQPGDAQFSHRFRFLNRVSIPFKGKTIEEKTFYFSAYDEIFVNAGKNIAFNIFDQNRLYAAFGYRFPKIGRLEIGYLNQFILKSDGVKVENNHTLQIGLTSAIEFRKKNE